MIANYNIKPNILINTTFKEKTERSPQAWVDIAPSLLIQHLIFHGPMMMIALLLEGISVPFDLGYNKWWLM